MANVLVVDDDVGSARFLAEMLELFGYEVHVAYGNEETLTRIKLSPPQVVVVHIGVPRKERFQLARRVRRACGQSIRLVAHAPFPTDKVVREIADAGFNGLVSRETSPIQLALEVQGAAGATELQRVGRPASGSASADCSVR